MFNSENREKLVFGPELKGKLIYAKYVGEDPYFGDWLVLVKKVDNGCIFSHFSIALDRGNVFFCPGEEDKWGNSTSYELYSATKEEKKKIINYLTTRGYRFVKILNKLIKR